MQNTVLVTGASGFIGKWVLRELLEAGARVVALDVRPATERWNRVLGVGPKDVVFSDMPLIDRDGLIAISAGNDIPSVAAPGSKQAGRHSTQDNAPAWSAADWEPPPETRPRPKV